jgi:hypothetical protein
MPREELQDNPFYVTQGGKEYKLCVKNWDNDKPNIYFFISSNAPLPDGAKQTRLPNGWEVTSGPRLKKKS